MYTISTYGKQFIVSGLKYYARGVSRVQDTFEAAIWAAQWFLKQRPPKRRLKPPMPLNKRFPTPRPFMPQAWGADMASRLTK